MRKRTHAENLTRLRLLYGMDQVEQDPENGTWWIGSERTPRLLNLDSVEAALSYLDRLPAEMLDGITGTQPTKGTA